MNKSIPFTVLKLGRTPLEGRYVAEPKVFVFREELAWNDFWRFSCLPRLSVRSSTLPKIDFAHQMVIGLTSGFRPTGGYRLQIDAIAATENLPFEQWVIHYTEQVPDLCVVTQQPTTPTLFVMTEKSEAAIELQGQTVTYPYT
ncbi:MAG: protease complex subunit PrcB family protein [Kovacikia sp.]